MVECFNRIAKNEDEGYTESKLSLVFLLRSLMDFPYLSISDCIEKWGISTENILKSIKYKSRFIRDTGKKIGDKIVFVTDSNKSLNYLL